MAAVVEGAEKIIPAGELRDVLGWLNPGKRQQGCDAWWQIVTQLVMEIIVQQHKRKAP